MNHIYHSIWNEALGAWIAVSEIATGQGKRSSNRRKLLATSLLICATPTWALPTGDALVAGQATVNTPNAGQMQINQASQNAVINWQGFSIAPNEAVNIQQPNANAALLNRVVGQDASQIQGQLNANGQVYLVNPNGVVFGKTAQVDVGGLVATTHNITNADFMKGNPHFTQDGAKGTVENHGTIKTPEGGVVALIGQSVTNTGTINTPKGTTALAAGKTVDLDFKGDGLVEVKVSEAALNAQITNNGAIQADGGRVVLTAKAAGQLIDTVINQQGIIRAQGLVERNGEIILDGGDNGITQVSGTLDASGNKAGEKGGRVIVTGDKVLIDNTAQLNATGNTGGGDILVGGSWQGEDTSIRQATATVVKKGATLDASATNKGKGGTVVAWSNIHDPNSATRAWGTFLAKGGVNGGDGGRIETSGHWLNVEGISVDTTTHKGQAGTWLLDPYNVTISNPSDVNGVFGTGVWTPTGTGSTVSATTIEAALNGGTSVNITTTGAGVEAGDITVASNINKTAGGTANLFLNADNSIIFGGGIGISSTSNLLNVVLNADTDSNGAGNISMGTGSSILSNGGNIILGGGICSVSSCNGYAIGTAGLNPQNRGIQLNNVILDALGGNIFLKGQGANTVSSNNFGVDIVGGSLLRTIGTGSISIDGVGAGSGGANGGVNVEGAGTSITTADGLIDIKGQGSNGGDFGNYGINVNSNANIQSTGVGAININGKGGNSASGTSNGSENGVWIIGNSTIAATNGTIDITGTAGSSLSGANIGMVLSANIISSGAGAMTFKGIGNGFGSTGLNIISSNIGWSGIGAVPTGDISLSASAAGSTDSIQLSSATRIESLGKLFLFPNGGTDSIGLAGGAGIFNLDATELSFIQPSFSNITVGTTTGNIRVGAIGWTLPAGSNSLTLENTGLGNIYLGGVISSPSDVTLKTGGSIIDNHTGTADIIANFLDITAGAGISVDMDVNQLQTVNNSTVNGSALRNSRTSQLNIFSLSDASVGTAIAGIQLSSLGDINISGAIQANSNLFIKSTGNILFGSTISSAVGPLNVTFQSDSDGINGGAIESNFGNINSNGGDITLAGGVDVTTGYAQGDGFHPTGIRLAYTTLNSGGGNIVVRGKSSDGLAFSTGGGGQSNGVYITGNSSINAGTGTINIEGVAQTNSNVSSDSFNGIEIGDVGLITIQSANTTANAIRLTGTANVDLSTQGGYGVLINSPVPVDSLIPKGTTIAGMITIAATGGGGITVTGSSNKEAGIHIDNNASILANRGKIILDGATTGSNSSAVESTGIIGQQVGSLVPTSSSDIDIIADSLNLTTSSLVGTPLISDRINSTGILTIKPKTANREMTVQAGEGDNSQLYVNTELFGAGRPISPNFSKIVFGSSTTGIMNVSGLNFVDTYSVDLLTGRDLTLADTTVTGINKVLSIATTGNGTVTSTGVLNVSNLLLNGTSANFLLNNPENTINTVAGILGSGSLNLKNSQTLTVGTINGINGIDPTGTGTVTIETLGSTSDLILDQPITTADGNIILAAGRNFINNVLPINSGISITGTGQYFVYSNNPTDSVEGMLNYNKHYNQTYTTGVVPSYAGAGHWFLYAIAPKLLVAPNLKTITYGDALTYTLTYTGFIDGDTATTAGISGTAFFDTLGSKSTSGNFIVGLHDAVYNSSFSSLLSSLGYSFADDSRSINELTVTPLTLVVEGISANSKVYDSTTNATLSGTAFVTPLASDRVSLGGTGIGFFDSPNVGNNSVTVSGYHLRGADDGNYLLQFPRLIANITPATLTYTANASWRFYGSANYPNFSGTVTGFVGTETLDTATTGLLTFTTTATPLSPIGDYPIIGSGLTANNGNYLFTQATANNTALSIIPVFITPPVLTRFLSRVSTGVSTEVVSPVEPVIQTNLVNNLTLLPSQLTSLQNSTTFLYEYQQEPQPNTEDLELIEVENGGIKLAKGWQMHIEFPVNSCAPTAINPLKS